VVATGRIAASAALQAEPVEGAATAAKRLAAAVAVVAKSPAAAVAEVARRLAVDRAPAHSHPA
jgi:hypothetical protein